MKRVYMIVSRVGENKGGMSTAMLSRSKAFYDHSYPADFITFDYNLDYSIVINNLRAANKMDKRTNVYNMFNYFEQKSRKNEFFTRTEKEYGKLLKVMNKLIKINSSKTSSRYYSKETGEYILFVNTKRNEIQDVDYYRQNKRYKRDNYYKKVKRLTEYFNEDNEKINEVYFNEKEQPYLNRTINPKNQNILNITLVAEKKRFKSNRKFASYFIDDLLEAKNDNVLICDGPGSLPRMLGVKTKNVKKIAVIHTNHFLYPYKYGSKVKKSAENIIKSEKKLDNIIVFTEKQKRDIVNHFGTKNIKVIPNFQTISKVEKKPKSKNIIGHVSRIHKDKGFDRLLKVAELVKEKDSSIKFHFYGTGKHEKRISKNISKHNLNDTVKLKGYTNNIKKVISTFDISVSASYFEAFGLSISESMEQKVPVIAMDINYGPSTLIKNDINGYLVADNDVKDMAEKIIELVQNKKKTKKFGKKAREKILNDLNPTKLMKEWKDIL